SNRNLHFTLLSHRCHAIVINLSSVHGMLASEQKLILFAHALIAPRDCLSQQVADRQHCQPTG
ncbi:TPA: hypothetical protein ACOQZT_004165, partial [Serratia odorifera]